MQFHGVSCLPHIIPRTGEKLVETQLTCLKFHCVSFHVECHCRFLSSVDLEPGASGFSLPASQRTANFRKSLWISGIRSRSKCVGRAKTGSHKMRTVTWMSFRDRAPLVR